MGLIQPRTDPSKLLRAATAVFRSAFHLGGWARTSPCRPRYLRSAGPARQRWTASRQRFDSRAWIGHELRILSDCKLQIIRKYCLDQITSWDKEQNDNKKKTTVNNCQLLVNISRRNSQNVSTLSTTWRQMFTNIWPTSCTRRNWFHKLDTWWLTFCRKMPCFHCFCVMSGFGAIQNV